MTAIAELEENRTVEGVYAVARKERLRTRNGSSYLALELVDPSGRIGARVWNDVELLDGRFETGDAVLVRLEPERRGEALAAPSDAVRADILLYEPPARRLGIAYEDSALLPLCEARGRLVLGVGQRQVDDVVPASPPERLPLFRSDDVVRRRDERSERSRDSHVVAERAERPYDCHGTDRTNRAASLPLRRLVRATTGDPLVHAR